MEAPFIDLLNSDWQDWRGSGQRKDLLDQPEWVDKFLSRWGLALERPLNEEERSALKNLRTLLRRLLPAARAEESYYENDLARLNGIFANSPMWRQLTIIDTLEIGGHTRKAENKQKTVKTLRKQFSLTWRPASKNINWVLAEIAASFAALLVEKEAQRLKICANPDCNWVFYDRSRGITRRWCDSKTCGNLLKVRRFRARQKAGHRDGSPVPPP